MILLCAHDTRLKNGKEKAKPSAFMKSKTYKENPEYVKIIKEVAENTSEEIVEEATESTEK